VLQGRVTVLQDSITMCYKEDRYEKKKKKKKKKKFELVVCYCL